MKSLILPSTYYITTTKPRPHQNHPNAIVSHVVPATSWGPTAKNKLEHQIGPAQTCAEGWCVSQPQRDAAMHACHPEWTHQIAKEHIVFARYFEEVLQLLHQIISFCLQKQRLQECFHLHSTCRCPPAWVKVGEEGDLLFKMVVVLANLTAYFWAWDSEFGWHRWSKTPHRRCSQCRLPQLDRKPHETYFHAFLGTQCWGTHTHTEKHTLHWEPGPSSAQTRPKNTRVAPMHLCTKPMNSPTEIWSVTASLKHCHIISNLYNGMSSWPALDRAECSLKIHLKESQRSVSHSTFILRMRYLE